MCEGATIGALSRAAIVSSSLGASNNSRARHKFPSDDAQRPDVRPPIGLAMLELLGRDKCSGVSAPNTFDNVH